MAEVTADTLVVIGNPLLDISTELSDETLLNKYDLKLGNAILADPAKHLPLYDELVKNYKVDYIAGGAAQNSARATQWMLQVPHAVHYIGCVGNDKFGAELKVAAEAGGVTTHYLIDEKTPTGTCAVLCHQKDRALIANLGAANEYKKTHFDSAEIQALIQKAKFFYSTGFFITACYEAQLALSQYAASSNKPYLMNISAVFVVDFFWDKLSEVLKNADVVFANETEAAALGKKAGWGENLEEIAQKLRTFEKVNKQRERIVIFTQGSQSTLVATSNGVEKFAVAPLAHDLIVDTNGAGDSFVGGFLSRFMAGASMKEAVEAGHYAARDCIQHSGATYSPKPNFVFTA